MDFETAHDLIRRDVEAGIAGFVTGIPDDPSHGFQFMEEFDRWRDGGVHTRSEDTFVVPWVFRGIHDVEPQLEGQEPRDVMGFVPTRQVVEVRGCTIAHWETDDAEPRFTRFIDWAGAMAQIGVTFLKRPVIDDPENAGMR